jgi:hypothetical protein
MKFEQLVADMGDFRDLAQHDAALKFWLPEPANEALREICARGAESMSAMLRRFLAQHCYGVYACELMKEAIPNLFNDEVAFPAVFRQVEEAPPAGKVRIDTYWVPELGKNVVPIKVWIPARVRADLTALAEHSEIKLSQYVREIVISRLLGHGTLPQRPQMLEAVPLAAADDWCEGREVPMRKASVEEFLAHPEGRRTTEWVDEQAAS